ncbi:MAG TPA: hypothetical protein VMV62_02455 [Candidatus Paceibacterota bacterium]|nr:hypothetical protein [Candidatus Paceibacterota bacterium]
MAANVIAEWEGREYEHDPKSADWYWSLGIITVAGTIASVLFGNILFAILILVAAAAIALHAAQHPPLHRFRLVDTGLMIGDDLFPFDRMLSFSVLQDIEETYPPILSIKTASWHAPHLMIPLEGADEDAVLAHFLDHVEEEEHRHTFADLVAAWLGF